MRMTRSANTRDSSLDGQTGGDMRDTAAVAMVFGEYVGSLVPGGVGREAETASAVIVPVFPVFCSGAVSGSVTWRNSSPAC